MGADADCVILDPAGRSVITAAALHSKAGYTPCEGREVHGRAVRTLQRGRTVLEDGEFRARAGWGRYLTR